MSGFFVEFRKDNYNEKYLKSLDLIDRQVKAVLYVKEKGKITNKEYQEMFGVARMTATRDLTALIEKGILNSSNTKGAGSYYQF